MDFKTSLELLGALSIASERVVEITKGMWPWLNKETPDDAINEGRRKAVILIFAVISGCLLAVLAKQTLGLGTSDKDWWMAISIGFLSAGGSGFWNSIQSSLNKLKESINKPAQGQLPKENKNPV